MKNQIKLMMLLTRKYRIYPNNSQIKFFESCFSACRFVYNNCLEHWRTVSDAKQKFVSKETCPIKLPTKFDHYVELTKALALPENKWLRICPVDGLRSAVDSLHGAIQKVFDRYTIHSDKIKWRSKYDKEQSFSVSKSGIIFGQNSFIIFPKRKIGRINYKKHCRLGGIPKIVTIKKQNDKWFICVAVEVKDKPSAPEGSHIGLDFGVVNNLTTSDGEFICEKLGLNHEFKELIPWLNNRIKNLQKKLSRAKKGSNRRKLLVKKIANLHEKIGEIRLKSNHKVTTNLAKRYKTIKLENLKIRI